MSKDLVRQFCRGEEKGFRGSPCEDERTITERKLYAVIANTQPFHKAERLTQPAGRLTHVGIGQFRDHGGGRGEGQRASCRRCAAGALGSA